MFRPIIDVSLFYVGTTVCVYTFEGMFGWVPLLLSVMLNLEVVIVTSALLFLVNGVFVVFL